MKHIEFSFFFLRHTVLFESSVSKKFENIKV